MGSVLKSDELNDYRATLLSLRSRLRGDLDQMTDEALKLNQPHASGNLSNVPMHMADVGTENFDQEFTLGLIENEQAIVGEIDEALDRLRRGAFGKCEECGGQIAKPRLQAIPYAKYCIECARKLESSQ